MLLPRIISAVIMALLFIYAVFILEPMGFELAMAVVVLFAGWEWARLSGITRQRGRLAFAGMVGTFCYGVALFELYFDMLWVAPVLWFTALYWVINYPTPKGWQSRPVRALFGLLVLVSTWSALVVMRDSSQFITWVLLLMALIWGADSGAYFSGKLFGKRKLAPSVSPGKSWEGVYGGLLLTQLIVVGFCVFQGMTLGQWLALALAALVTVLVSVLGDLTESLLKRHESMKDSSQLIPGHGGVMDRVDSLTSAAPIFVLLLALMGWV